MKNPSAAKVPGLLMFVPGGIERSDVPEKTVSLGDVTSPIAKIVKDAENADSAMGKGISAMSAKQPGILTQTDLDVIVSAAIARWELTGLSTQQTAVLRGLSFKV